MKYELKHETIEAIQWLGDNLKEVEEFCSLNGKPRAWVVNDNPFLLACMKNSIAIEDAHVGDFIMRRFYEVNGEEKLSLKVVKGEVFNLFFQPTSELVL